MKHIPTPEAKTMKEQGYYVETWGGGRYQSVAWCATRAEAERELAWIKNSGGWSGMPPRIVASARAGAYL